MKTAFTLLIFRLVISGCSKPVASPLLVYCGAGIRLPASEIALIFEKEKGVKVECIYNGSNILFGQIKLTHKGDIFIPGEVFYVEQAKAEGLIEDSRIAAYFIPVILVQKGNPKKISGLGGLTGSRCPYKKQNPTSKEYYRIGAFSPGLYIDNGFKNYVFNNIFWGKNNNENDFIYNSVGYFDYNAIQNTVFNNTIYNCAVGIHKGGEHDNRNYYLNNLIINTYERYIRDTMTARSQLDSVGYTCNLFNGQTKPVFGMLGLVSLPTKADFINYLVQRKSICVDPGQEVSGQQVIDAPGLDFHLLDNSAAIDKAKKVFVPWGLYAVVGEWNFYKYPADINRVLDEHSQILTPIRWPDDGGWHCYETQVKLNTIPGVANGEAGFWLDGVLKVKLTDVPWVKAVAWKPNYDYSTKIADVVVPTSQILAYRVIADNGFSGSTEPNWPVTVGEMVVDGDLVWECFTDYKWNWLQFIDNMVTSHDTSAHVEESLYMDDVVVSTEYISPEYIIGSISCDINADGQVNVLDVQLCVNVILEIEKTPVVVQKAKEITEPKDVCTVSDLQAVVNEILNSG